MSLWSLSPFPLCDYSWTSKVLSLSFPWRSPGGGRAWGPQTAADAGRARGLDVRRSETPTAAASLPEERKSSLQDPRPAVHRIYVEAYPAALVDTKPWAALNPAVIGHSGLPSAGGPELSPEDPTTSPVSEILSSML